MLVANGRMQTLNFYDLTKITMDREELINEILDAAQDAVNTEDGSFSLHYFENCLDLILPKGESKNIDALHGVSDSQPIANEMIHFKRENGKYVTYDGEELSIDFITSHRHAIIKDFGIVYK